MSKRHGTATNRNRFGLVGIINTALDVGLLLWLQTLGLPIVVANLCSTSIAFVGSFFMNRRFTFSAQAGNAMRQLIRFCIVTLAGLWIVQSGIIWILHPALAAYLPNGAASLIAKLAATVASLLWNYYWYLHYVFPAIPDDTVQK